jgi:hypothetical protein
MSEQLVNPIMGDNDTCSICLDDLNNEQTYQLPECSHKYHTNCIMQWMRSGNCKCPYCGNLGEGLHENNEEQSNYSFYSKDRYIVLRQFSKQKDAPIILKKLFIQLKKLELKDKNYGKNIKEIQLQNGNFKDIKKLFAKTNNSRHSNKFRIRKLKRDICENSSVIPLILVKKKFI